MARTKQTWPPPPKPVLRVQHFIDHTGTSATRLRYARPGAFGDIADDFRTNPVFAVQVYSLIPWNFEAPAAKRARRNPSDSASESNPRDANLLALVRFLGGDVDPKRAPPVFDIYAEQTDAFACVAHQKREIADRKAHAADPGTLLIPKLESAWDNYHLSRKVGFCIIITSDVWKQDGMSGGDTAEGSGLLWARFKRGGADWPFDVSFAALVRDSAQNDVDSNFAGMYNLSFSRRSIDVDLPFDDSEIVQPLEQYCDVGIGEAEECDEALSEAAPDGSLEEMARRLSLDTFLVKTTADGAIVVSNYAEEVEPSLRYLIYVPFLVASGVEASLEEVAKAFTASITSRMGEDKTVSFEFRKPSSQSRGDILEDFRARIESQTDDFIGALLDLEEDFESPAFEGRLHCNGASLRRTDNIPDEEEDEPPESTRYKTMIVVLRGPNVELQGNVEYLLADAVPGSSVEEEYNEMILWRNESIDETARMLEMRFDDDD